MYSSIIETNGTDLITLRLQQLIEDASAIRLPTKEEVQAEVYSRLNAILRLGNQVYPLTPIAPETPAAVGDLEGNLQLINQDVLGIARLLLALEQESARLYNLYASTHNAVRQAVRESVYMTTRRRYLEPFITDTNLAPGDSSVDFSAGMATLPFLGETQVAPSAVELGILCAGVLENSLAPLTDGASETSMVWNGSQLDLLITFNPVVILNRFILEMDDYQGLNLEVISSSPDGILQENILSELGFANRSIEGSSNKFSGQFTADFNARHVKQMRIVISDRVGIGRISLRGIGFWSRRYQPAGTLQSQAISFPDLGLVTFNADQSTAPGLTAITHQLSFDGMQYRFVSPGEVVDLAGRTCWYRTLFERNDENFKESTDPLLEDPGLSTLDPLFKILSIASKAVGNNIVQHTIVLDLLAPPGYGARNILLRGTPLAGSLTVYQGAALLGPAEYTFAADILSFSGDEIRSGLLISYQVSSDPTLGIEARKPFYTPRLYQVSFERVQ